MLGTGEKMQWVTALAAQAWQATAIHPWNSHTVEKQDVTPQMLFSAWMPPHALMSVSQANIFVKVKFTSEVL